MIDYPMHLREGVVLFAYLNILMLLVWPLILAVEKLDPVHRDVTFKHYWFNWKVSLSNLLLGPVFAGVAFIVTFSIAAGIGAPYFDYPKLSVGIGIPALDLIVQGASIFLISCFLSDFAYYWWHRFQHTVPVLWELHKLHHSEERMNVTTMPRSHFLEQTGQAIFRGLIVGLVFDLSQQGQTTVAIIAAGLLPVLWNFLIHSNVRLNALHRLVPFFSTPQYHRLHHSRLPEHQDVNFAVYLPLFDVIFGSYCKPGKEEFPPTGLSSGEKIETLRDAQLGPLRILWQTLFPNRVEQSRKFSYPSSSADGR